MKEIHRYNIKTGLWEIVNLSCLPDDRADWLIEELRIAPELANVYYIAVPVFAAI